MDGQPLKIECFAGFSKMVEMPAFTTDEQAEQALAEFLASEGFTLANLEEPEAEP